MNTIFTKLGENAVVVSTIFITVQERRVTALLDSGANTSYINSYDGVLNPSKMKVRLAKDTCSINAVGETQAQVEIGGKESLCSCLVVSNLNYQMILGADFLNNDNATFDFRRRCVHLADLRQRTTIHWGTKADDDRHAAETNQTVPSRLPPQHHSEFQGLIVVNTERLPKQLPRGCTRHHYLQY